ncbi:aminoglycoside phosphotransferase family protein [Streptomyces sp. XM4193]|uniref:phosphotransferase n=1 Tax=Streptomyces sp. XM4193 TaxID=2929782 RepID=UPI001FF9D9E8|nr:phosphotransferase [Streptomyces sp. XM4193]MCK1797897.1 aminoglycoside phosphotransferase family protein [Streptomyces sp. XM4193]
MTDFATPKQLADRTAAAVEAAVTAGRELGLTVTDARVLHDVFSVVVHLAPAPVVARVPTVLPESTDLLALARRQREELAVTRWLADRGTPVVPPSPLVPAEPVQRGGFSMTFWEFLEEDREAEPDYARNAELTAELHAALRDYPGELPFLSAAEPDYVEDSLAALEGRTDLIDPALLERARREWEVLGPLVRSRAAFEEAFPGAELQPVHGDCPPANIFQGVDGHRFADFELITLGPAEWDLASLGAELGAAYDRGARHHGLRPLDPRVQRFVDAVGMLRVVATLTLVPQLPVLADYLKPALEQWPTMPFAGGLAD